MGELGQVIELMQSARTRYSALEARIHSRMNMALIHEAMTRQMDRAEPGTVAWTAEPIPGPAEEFPELREHTVRLRVRAPSRWRIDVQSGENQGHVERGWRWWMEEPSVLDPFSPGQLSSDFYPEPAWLEEIYDPALLVAELWLEPLGRTEVAGREGLHVRGTPRPTMRAGGMEFLHIDPAGDGYGFVVDAERGILLRFEATLEGEAMEFTEVLSVEFDREMPDEIFENEQ